MSSNKFYNDLAAIVKETAADCKLYSNLCDEVEFDFNTTLNDSNLGELPYQFKQSNDKFKELLRGDTFEKLEYWMESSSTCGDPSIVGRLDDDIQVLKSNYNDVFNSYSIKDQINNLILFAPNVRFINKMRHKFYGKNTYLLYKSIVDIWEGKHINYLLQLFFGKTIWKIVTSFKLRVVVGINGKSLKSELNRVDKKKIPTIIANSPLWMHKVLKDYYQKQKRTFDMSENIRIITGGGGWDGTKGRVKLGQRAS